MTIMRAFAGLGILAFLFLVLIILIVVILFSLKNKARLKILIISVCVMLVIFISYTLWLLSHGETHKYNDWWIVGNEVTDVAKRYGAFDIGKYEKGYSGEVAYYLFEDHGGIMPSHQSLYYYIRYDDNGIVTDVFVGGPYGG